MVLDISHIFIESHVLHSSLISALYLLYFSFVSAESVTNIFSSSSYSSSSSSWCYVMCVSFEVNLENTNLCSWKNSIDDYSPIHLHS